MDHRELWRSLPLEIKAAVRVTLGLSGLFQFAAENNRIRFFSDVT